MQPLRSYSLNLNVTKRIFMGWTNSIEGFLIYTAGKPHPFWQELGEPMGSHPDEVWLIGWEFITSFLITLEVDTCFIHPFPLAPGLSQRICTEMLAVICFLETVGCCKLLLSFLWEFFFCIFFQLQPIIARGVFEVWVLIYLTVVILLMTLPLSAATATLTLQGAKVASSSLDSHKSASFLCACAFSCFKRIMQCAAYSIIMLLFLCLFKNCRLVVLSI